MKYLLYFFLDQPLQLWILHLLQYHFIIIQIIWSSNQIINRCNNQQCYNLFDISQIYMKDNLKESTHGRIVSQRKTQMSLIREYDTKTTINFDRINQLKMKYIKNEARTPLMALNSNQLVSVSDFTNQSRQRATLIEKDRIKNQQAKRVRNQDILQFRKKAQYTNNVINERLNYIEEEINRWKNMKQTQIISQAEFRVRQLDKQTVIRIPESIKVSIIQEVQPRMNTVSDNLQAKIAKKASQLHKSNIKLLGQFKPERNISEQFITFINRLKDQISLDYDFTQILLSLPANDRQSIKQYVKKNHPTADKQYFSISPVEYDPLQTEVKVSYNGTTQSISKKLYEFYLKIQDHYKVKLFRNFQLGTIDTLFEQIGEKQMTLGHLISYLNMRTGKQFRNRCLVKLLRRMGVSGPIIEQRAFMKNFVRS